MASTGSQVETPGGASVHAARMEPVTGLEPASPPWEGGVLTRGRYRHVILNFQFPILNFEARGGGGAIPTPAAIERRKKKYEVRRYICAPGGWPRSIMEGGVGLEPHTELVPASAAPCPPISYAVFFARRFR